MYDSPAAVLLDYCTSITTFAGSTAVKARDSRRTGTVDVMLCNAQVPSPCRLETAPILLVWWSVGTPTSHTTRVEHDSQISLSSNGKGIA